MGCKKHHFVCVYSTIGYGKRTWPTWVLSSNDSYSSFVMRTSNYVVSCGALVTLIHKYEKSHVSVI